MKKRSIARVAALWLLLQVGGCSAVGSHWPYRTMPPRATAPIHPRPSASSATIREKPPAAETNDSYQSETSKKATATSTGAVSTSTVTLDDNDADRHRAQALIDDASTRLARIDRSKLKGEDNTAYNQASVLANAARKAMEQRDYLAASGLARKASILTAQLVARTSPQ
jgi:hypothetical protein